MPRKNNLGNKANTNGFDKNPENINRSGANRKSMSSILKELVDGKIIDIEIKLTDENGKTKLKKINLKSKTDIKTALNMMAIQKALTGDLGFFKEIYDRTEGKAVQRQEIDANIEGYEPPTIKFIDSDND